jgi:hypothetical protein
MALFRRQHSEDGYHLSNPEAEPYTHLHLTDHAKSIINIKLSQLPALGDSNG